MKTRILHVINRPFIVFRRVRNRTFSIKLGDTINGLEDGETRSALLKPKGDAAQPAAMIL
jgi:hypothetical protein